MKTITLAQLQKEISKIYLIDDPYITKAICALAISHFISGDPVWAVIVAPSGGGKSEFINMLYKIEWTRPATPENPEPDLEKVHPLSTLTSKTFISGQKITGKDTSLLLQIDNGVITFKDLTSLLSEHKEERGVIMGQLREIYDGKYSKSFGTGETLKWAGKITIIAGSTYKIHSIKQQYAAMGERFIFYNMEQPARKDAARRAMKNQEEGKMTEHREHLANKVKEYVENVLNNMPKELIAITDEQREDTLALAELATRARSDVERNWSSREQEITEVHPPEMPTRFAGQLQTIMRSLMILNHHETGKMELLPEDEKIIAKFALDSVTRSRRIAMIELSQYDVLETAGIATKIGMPTNSVKRWVEDLVALEIADRQKGSGPKGDKWSIKAEYRALIMRYEGVKHEGETLTEQAQLLAEVEELKAQGIEPPHDSLLDEFDKM